MMCSRVLMSIVVYGVRSKDNPMYDERTSSNE
jgi:hypothetical protein